MQYDERIAKNEFCYCVSRLYVAKVEKKGSNNRGIKSSYYLVNRLRHQYNNKLVNEKVNFQSFFAQAKLNPKPI